MDLWDYLYGRQGSGQQPQAPSLWDYLYGGQKKPEEEDQWDQSMAPLQSHIRSLIEQHESRGPTPLNTTPETPQGPVGPGFDMGPPQPVSSPTMGRMDTSPEQFEQITQPDLINAQSPVEDLGPSLQQAWQQEMQNLTQPDTTLAGMTQPPFGEPVERQQFMGGEVGHALNDWTNRQQQEQMQAPAFGEPVERQQYMNSEVGPALDNWMGQQPQPQSPHTMYPDVPAAQPGQVSHEAQTPQGPGLLTRLVTGIADAGSAGWDKYRDFEQDVEEAAYGSDKMIGTISRFLRGADREASVEALRVAESVAEVPTRLIEVGKAVVDADYRVLDAITKSGNTNDVSAWVSDFGDALKAQAPEDQTTEEKIGGIVGMFGVMAAEYGVGGGLIRSALGLNKAAKGLEVTKEFSKIAKWLKNYPGAARRAQWLANTAALSGKRVAGNVAAYGPIDLTQVWTGDASLPYLVEMLGEEKTPDWMKAMNQSDLGRGVFELVIGASADLLFESVSAGRVVARERTALGQATGQAAKYARENKIPLRDVPLTEGRGKLVTEPAQTDMFGVASGPDVTRRLPGEERIRLPEVRKRHEQILSDQRNLGATAQEAAQRGQEALGRAWKRFQTLSNYKASTLPSTGSELEVFFDPEIVRDMGIWGGALLTRFSGQLARAEFDNVLKKRFPGIADNVLGKAWGQAEKKYEAYLKTNLDRKMKEWSHWEDTGVPKAEGVKVEGYTRPELMNEPDAFGSLAEELLEIGVKEGGHEWYDKEFLPYMTSVLGSEDDAKAWVAFYSVLSGGGKAGEANITWANQAFAKWKAGESWQIPEGGFDKKGKPIWGADQKVGRRGATVATLLGRITEAIRLTGEPGQGINSIKFGNFYGALTGKERTVIDQWIMRVYGYEFWKDRSLAKVNPKAKIGKQLENAAQSETVGIPQYEFIAADIDRIAWETRPGGKLEHIGKLAGRPLRQEEVQAAIWVGAQAYKFGKPDAGGAAIIDLVRKRIEDVSAHRSTKEFTQQMLAVFGTLTPAKSTIKRRAAAGNEFAKGLLAESGSANIAAVAYLSNTTAGALAGLGVGDTWEERLSNALKLGVGGALGTRVAHGWIRSLKDTKGLKESIAFMFKDPTPPAPNTSLKDFARTPLAKGGAAGGALGGAAGYEETGTLRGAAQGALTGMAAGAGGAQLLAHSKIGRRMGWDERGAVGDLTSFKDIPHEAKTELIHKIGTSGPVRQSWLAEIELQNLDDNVEEVFALMHLGHNALDDLPRMGVQLSTAARSRIEQGVEMARQYIRELAHGPMTSETLRQLDRAKKGDIRPAVQLKDGRRFEGPSHADALTKASKETEYTWEQLTKTSKAEKGPDNPLGWSRTRDLADDGFVVRTEDGQEVFLTRNEATQYLRAKGALTPRLRSEAGFASGELLRAVRDVMGGAAAGGAVGGSFDTDNRKASALTGAAIGAGLGIGSVRGRKLRQEAVGYAKESMGSRVKFGQQLQERVKSGTLNVRQFKSPNKLRQYMAGQGEEIYMNATRTAAYVPGKEEIVVLSDEAAQKLGYTQRDLISHMISEPDVQAALKANPKAAQEALQKIRQALTGPGGYKEQAEASGLAESALRYMDRLERQAEDLQIPERQLQREALAATLAAERVASGVTGKATMKGSIKPRASFTKFLGEITKFNVATQSAEKRLADVWDAHRKAEKLKKTVQHDKTVRREVANIVRDMGLDPDGKALDLVPGTTKEQMLAIRDIVSRNAEDLDKISDHMANNVLTADETRVLAAHADALTKQIGDMLERFSKVRTEYGRNLRSLQLVAHRLFDPSKRSTWYLLAQERSPTGLLTEEMRMSIDAFLAEGNKEGLVDYLARLKPASKTRKALRFWKAMLLTSPKTHLRNILGNTAMATLEELKDVPAFGADFLVTQLARKAGYDAQYTKALKNIRMISKAGRNGATEGMADAWKALKGRDPEMTLKQVKEKLDIIGEVHMDNRFLEGVVTMAFRTLSAEDKFFRSVASSRSLLEQAATMARNEGLAAKKGKDWMRTRTRELMAKPTDEMMMRAVEDAEWAVFQNSNYWARQINRLKRGPGGPVVEYLMPFVNTPMNIFSRIIDYSPAGGVIAAKKAKELLRKAEITGTLDPRLQKEFVDRVGRATVGTTAMLTGYLFYKADAMRVSYPDKPSEREKWKLTGEQDGSILMPLYPGGEKKWRNIRNVSPIGNLMLIGGAIAQLEDDPEVRTNLVTLAEGAGGAAIEQFREMPMLTGINTFSRAIDNWDYESGRMTRNMARSMVPAILRDLSRAVDSTVRSTRGGPVESAQGSFPGASRNLPPQVDVLGRELTRDQGPVGSFFDLFSSRKDKRDTKDPVVRALLDLEVNISARGRYDGETEWQYSRRAQAQGKDLYDRIQREIATEQFRRLPPEEQADHLRGRVSVWRRRMTEAWDDAHPDYP